MKEKKTTGPKPKYDEPTVMMSFRVPKSKKELVRKAVKDFLSEVEIEKPNRAVKITILKSTTPMPEKIKCGCYMENGLMKRGKDAVPCKLTKKEHTF